MSGHNDALFELSRDISAKFLGYYKMLLTNAVKLDLIPEDCVEERALEMGVYVLGAMFYARMTNTLESVGPSLETALMRIAGFASPSEKPKKMARPIPQSA